MNLIKTIKHTWKIYWKNKKELPIAIISDFLFYYLAILLIGYVLNKMILIAQQIAEIAGDLTSITAMQSTQAAAQYKEVSKTMWILFIGLFVIWTVFKGISWWQAHKTIGERIKPKEFILKFALVSTAWYGMVLLLFFLSAYANYKVYMTQLINPVIIGIITILLLLKILYFGTTAYSILAVKNPIKNAFKTGMKKWKKTILAYILTLITFIISAVIFYLIAIQNTYIALAVTLLILLPALHYFRLLHIELFKK